MADIDAKKIEELRGLLAKASPGPWLPFERYGALWISTACSKALARAILEPDQ